jgi:hypothetical protein
MERWPVPKHDSRRQPHVLFIITPPYSGSTALAQLINSSPHTMFFHPRAEGQWLIPGLCEIDRWNPEKSVDYKSVSAVWLRAFQDVSASRPEVSVVIEKSPPNMVRIQNLSALFRTSSFLASNRDPYANCASILHRRNDVSSLKDSQRATILKELVRGWIRRSRWIDTFLSSGVHPLITYESFCNDPSQLLHLAPLPLAVKQSIDPQTKVKVKDYPLQSIVCQNDRQVGLLTEYDIKVISSELDSARDMLDRFGYLLLG